MRTKVREMGRDLFMKKIKILHCADIHFDTPFKEFKNNLSTRSKEELKDVFSKIIDLCNKEEVEIMLLAGDIFDNYTLSRNTLVFIKESLERLIDTKVFISPGNHDPYNFKSFYNLVEWPDNVHVFKGEMENVILEDKGVCVYGAAFNENYVNSTIFKNINVDNDLINLLVIHGEIANEGSTNEYNPIYVSDIEKSDLDYVALGHRHKFSGICRVGKTSYAYSGCPQGRGFDELGEKGVLVGEIGKDYVNLRFEKTCIRKYMEEEVNINGLFGYREIKRKILSDLKNLNLKKDIFKLNLIGELDASFKIDEDILQEKLSNDFYFVKVKDKTNIKIDIDSLENENSIKGLFVKNLKKKLIDANDEEKEIVELALKIGLQSLKEEEVNLDDY